jgi:hypothetical protein
MGEPLSGGRQWHRQNPGAHRYGFLYGLGEIAAAGGDIRHRLFS